MKYFKRFVSMLISLMIPCVGTNRSNGLGIQWTRNKTTEQSVYEEEIVNSTSTTEVTPLTHCSVALQAEWCPPWHYCGENGQCKCGITPYSRLICVANEAVSVLNSYCVTFDKNMSRSEVGLCMYNYRHVGHFKVDKVYNPVPLNLSEIEEIICGKSFNRQGTLCGTCKPNHYPQAFSYSMACVKCDHIFYNLIKLILLAFLPLTVFYFIILFFQVSVLHSHLDGFVLAVSIPAFCRSVHIAYSREPFFYYGLKFLALFYNIWNLDILRSFAENICFQSNFLLVTSLGYVIALYPIALILLTYIFIALHDKGFKPLVYCLKPIRYLFLYFKIELEIKTSLVDAFSTFILLSSVKTFTVAMDLLTPVNVHFLSVSGNRSTSYRLYFDAMVDYLDKTHFPYVIITLIIIVPLIILPILTLMIYPFKYFQKFLNKLPLQLQIFLHTYIDTFYGSYKEGTEEGSGDCRWFASLFILTRSFLIMVFGYTLNIMYLIIGSIMLVILSILVIIFQPFKQSSRNKFLILHLLCLVGLYVSTVGKDIAGLYSWRFITVLKTLMAAFSTAPVLYTTYLLFCWLFHRNCAQKVTLKIKRILSSRL